MLNVWQHPKGSLVHPKPSVLMNIKPKIQQPTAGTILQSCISVLCRECCEVVLYGNAANNTAGFLHPRQTVHNASALFPSLRSFRPYPGFCLQDGMAPVRQQLSDMAAWQHLTVPTLRNPRLPSPPGTYMRVHAYVRAYLQILQYTRTECVHASRHTCTYTYTYTHVCIYTYIYIYNTHVRTY